MNILETTQRIFVFLALLTSVGTLVHDTKLNKAIEMSVPLTSFSTNLSSHLEGLSSAASHTHVESAMVSQSADATPRTQTRDDHRRYLLPRNLSKGDMFGGSRIVWPSV